MKKLIQYIAILAISLPLMAEVTSMGEMRQELVNIYKLSIDEKNIETIRNISEEIKVFLNSEESFKKRKKVQKILAGLEIISTEENKEIIKGKADELIRLLSK